MYDVRMEGFERVKNVKFASDISMELLHWLPPAECVILGKENFNFTIFINLTILSYFIYIKKFKH